MEVDKLLKCFNDYSCYGNNPSKEEMISIVKYLNKGYYEQIISSFPPHFILVVLKYFEDIEEYEICQKIINRIAIHNQISSKHIASQLEECK